MGTILADIFLSDEAQNILKNKYVLMIGDSVIRSMYKDLVKFLQTNDHLNDQQLKVKVNILKFLIIELEKFIFNCSKRESFISSTTNL